MKTYTKKERLEIYKQALLKLKNRNHDCLCGAIHSVIDAICLPTDIPSYFEEIMAIKPADVPIGSYWWKLGDFNIRIKNLNIIIEQMEKSLTDGKA